MPLVQADVYQFTTYSRGYRIPYQFKTGKVLVEVSSVEGQLFDWLRAGWINEVVLIDGVEAKSYCKSLRFTRTAVNLKPFRIPYQLEFVPQKWVRDALLKVWEVTPSALINSFTVPQSATVTQLANENYNREGVTIINKSSERLILNTGVVLEPDGYYETPFRFVGEITGSWSATGLGYAEVREFL